MKKDMMVLELTTKQAEVMLEVLDEKMNSDTKLMPLLLPLHARVKAYLQSVKKC